MLFFPPRRPSLAGGTGRRGRRPWKGTSLTQPDGGAGGGIEPADEALVSRRDRRASLARPTVPAIGVLPLRLFLGVTYLYAGVDKLASAHFLATGDQFSVAAQMAGYARTSPLAPLIDAAMPVATQIGLLIALAELAIGLGLLTGLAYRVAAGAGAALSLLFWLTASWSIAPYFFSPDLPYALGFLTLALAGHGGLFVLAPFTRLGAGGGRAAGGSDVATGSRPIGRRSFLEAGVLAVLVVVAAAAAASLRLLRYGTPGAASPAAGVASTAAPSAPSTPAATSALAETPAPSAAPTTPVTSAAPTTPAPTAAPTTAAPSGPVIGNLADFSAGNSIAFTVPFEAPTELGPGAPAIMVKLGDGSVVAYNAVCTHGRCTVGFDPVANVLLCPCHSATFDPAKQATVLSGPAPSALTSIPVLVDQATGQIRANLPH